MTYLILITLGLYFILLIKVGPIAALLATSTWVLLCTFLYIRHYYRSKLRYYGKRLENFYVFQQSPTDKKVVIRAREHERWIRLSGNTMDVRVLTIFFQDAHNPSETWEEYTERVAATIANDRMLRHTEIETTQGRDYYLREMHGQRGIRLPEEAPTLSQWQRLFTRLKKTA